MKVGLITFQRSMNFGAFLQCHALACALSGLGHEVEVIDYHPAHRKDKSGPRNLLHVFHWLKFRRTIRAHLPLSSRTFHTLEHLRENAGHLDAIVCGSDQIWNPGHTGDRFDPAYFGNFGRTGARRVSYAASLGGTSIDPAHHDDFKRLAANLDAISLREESGRIVAESILERPCFQMPDPTFLPDSWSALARPAGMKTPYILSHRMQQSELYDQVLAQAMRSTGLPVVHVADRWKSPPGTVRAISPTPWEWLGWVAGAAHVVTNSFHGAVFGIRFHRNLTCVGLQARRQEKTTRTLEMLTTFGLPSLLVTQVSDANRGVASCAQTNWIRVESVLAQERRRGLDFLRKALANSHIIT